MLELDERMIGGMNGNRKSLAVLAEVEVGAIRVKAL